MARRRRASMREGPLADLFRSTARQEPDEDTRVLGDREEAPAREPAEREIPPSQPEIPPDPERVRAYRVDEREPVAREPRERLNRIFSDEAHDVEGPTYGRDEPGLGDYHGPPRPHLPVIRVV